MAEAQKSPADLLIEQHDAAMSEKYTDVADRKNHFHTNKSPDDLRALTVLAARADSMRDRIEKKKFFLAHPELEVRFSAAWFKE